MKMIWRSLGIASIVVFGPAVFGGILVACFLALVWILGKLASFQHWGLAIGAACYAAMSGVIAYAIMIIRQRDL